MRPRNAPSRTRHQSGADHAGPGLPWPGVAGRREGRKGTRRLPQRFPRYAIARGREREMRERRARAPIPPPSLSPTHLGRAKRLGLLLGQHDALDGPLREPLEDGGDVEGAAARGGGAGAPWARTAGCGVAARPARRAGQGGRHPARTQVQGAGRHRRRQAGGSGRGGGPGGARVGDGRPHLCSFGARACVCFTLVCARRLRACDAGEQAGGQARLAWESLAAEGGREGAGVFWSVCRRRERGGGL